MKIYVNIKTQNTSDEVIIMTMGQRIRYLRKEKGITQEELGNIIGVQKSAIRKYEKDEVKNIPRSKIEKMAEYFGVAPSYLMAFDESNEECQLAKEVKVIECIKEAFGSDAENLFISFLQLNDEGKKKAVENLEDLTAISKYVLKDE